MMIYGREVDSSVNDFSQSISGFYGEQLLFAWLAATTQQMLLLLHSRFESANLGQKKICSKISCAILAQKKFFLPSQKHFLL
jgi:hypothetical protein